jgi:asparagine synthase (glutamine-hydrolysing)
VFPGTHADESHYAEIVREKANTQAHIVAPTHTRFMAQASDFVWHNELPVGSASQFAQWCVFAEAKAAGVTVLLDGQGADEALGGYEQYFRLYLKALADVGDHDRLAQEEPLIRERYPLALAPATHSLRDRLPLRLRHFVANSAGKGSSYLYLLKPDLAQRVSDEIGYREEAGLHPLAAALRQDSFGRFLTTLLRYGDRNSMAHSREVRLPFCDHRIAEFVLGLPPALLMGEVQTKRLIREGLRAYLPDAIRTRWNKQGFRPPQDLWFADPAFLDFVQDTLTAARAETGRLYTRGALDKMMARIRQGELSLGWTLWHPFILELWRSGFVDRIKTERAAIRTAGIAA